MKPYHPRRERRYKTALLDKQLLIQILNGFDRCEFYSLPICEQIPEGAEVVTAEFDVCHDALRVVIFHESYPVVPDGDRCPEIRDILMVKQFRRVRPAVEGR